MQIITTFAYKRRAASGNPKSDQSTLRDIEASKALEAIVVKADDVQVLQPRNWYGKGLHRQTLSDFANSVDNNSSDFLVVMTTPVVPAFVARMGGTDKSRLAVEHPRVGR